MKTLVIGGNRFFGKRLVSLLIEGGHQVTVLNRGNLKDEFGDRIQRMRLDRTTLHANHPDLGRQSWDVVYDQVCFTATEAEAACETFRNRTGHYVFVSSQSVYDLGSALPEEAFNPREHRFESIADPRQQYAEAKRQCESIFAQKSSFPVTSVRMPIVLGTDDYTERMKFHVDRISEGKTLYFPNPQAKIGFLNSSDASQLLYFLRDCVYGKPLNCCSRQPIPLIDLIHQIESATGRKANLSDLTTVPNSKSGPEQKEEEEGFSPFGISADWFMDPTAMENLGFLAKPLQDWLPDLIKHYSQMALKMGTRPGKT